ncbi:MAG: serine/threonine-protein kinase [Candidatus Aceula meridiana]|nr:serine/threonine-protein kinase [Candidatus Aceula meridiana]
MTNFNQKTHKPIFCTGICLALVWLLVLGPALPYASYAQTAAVLPQANYLAMPPAGTRISPSQIYTPVLIKGIQIDPINPFNLDFIIDTGNSNLDDQALKKETERLVRYFLTALTIPDDEFWVNLSPFEQDKIITEDFSATEMGRDLLAQDYLLKQVTASLIYPEDELGKNFWKKVYKKAYDKYGTTNIPTDTFNKVWIMPKTAKIYQEGRKVFVVESTLEVLLEEDYLAKTKSQRDSSSHQKQSRVASEIVREIIVPEIEKEVNEGKNFAPLRQIYHAVILATWFRKNLKGHLINQAYSSQSKINGINTVNKKSKEEIYAQYLAAYKKGAYNLIRVERDEFTQKNIPRKYFAGGIVLNNEIISAPTKVKKKMSQQILNSITGAPKLLKVKLRNLWKNSQLNKRINESKYYQKELERMSNIPKPIAEKIVDILKKINRKFEPTKVAVYNKEAHGNIKNIRERPARLNLILYFNDTNGFKTRSTDTTQRQYEQNLTIHIRYLLMTLEDLLAPKTETRKSIRKLIHNLESPFIIKVVGAYCASTETLKPFYGLDEYLGQTTHKFFALESTGRLLEEREVLNRKNINALDLSMNYIDDNLYFGDVHQNENKMGRLGSGTATDVFKTPYRSLTVRIKYESNTFENDRNKRLARRTEENLFKKLSKLGIAPNAYKSGEVNDYNYIFVDRIIGTSLDEKYDDLRIEKRGLRYNKVKMIENLLRTLLKNRIIVTDFFKPSNIMIGRFYGINHTQAFICDVMKAQDSKRGLIDLAKAYKIQLQQTNKFHKKVVAENPKENWKIYDPKGYLIEFLDYVIENGEIPDSEWANTLAGEEEKANSIKTSPDLRNTTALDEDSAAPKIISSPAKKFGGIDLTADNIDLEIEGNRINPDLFGSAYQIYADDIAGLQPVTIDISPISNFSQFFNLK